ncbi:hypothetical protein GV828_08810 [Flavobacterium sp. NST-5]|uniref:DUF5615 domain-containing protein n=1 Tax=Flavobacterium ichthyis TaxID=2698827 RepID=A0ABW9Z9L1_9FLAO|nr:DUF5615 family PIN-like protein [Flavobacterium ichthyis]NBL65294.1 hypothetical protein [Flavobacterium ichthyis]
MKLLFDQNIPFRILSKINSEFAEAQQGRNLGIENFSDVEIWKFAKVNNYTIVTFDADFFDLANLKRHPPKIIWLRLGNSKTDYLAEVLNSKSSIIKEFIASKEFAETACLEIK